jgi:hypothetical protein
MESTLPHFDQNRWRSDLVRVRLDGSSAVERLSGLRSSTSVGLGIEPAARSRDLDLNRRVAVTRLPRRPEAAAPADRHAAVGFGKVILVEPSRERLRFGGRHRDLSSGELTW